jgi:hypothetical protein
VASELVVPRPDPHRGERPSFSDTLRAPDTPTDASDVEVVEVGCVICGEDIPEVGACCSSRCAGEAQRQLRRNAARLRRLERRDAHELRHHLSERNGRLMSAILRWRPDTGEPSLS